MDINFEYYKIFYYVAKYSNFTKAAHALGNSQPSGLSCHGTLGTAGAIILSSDIETSRHNIAVRNALHILPHIFYFVLAGCFRTWRNRIAYNQLTAYDLTPS